MKSKAGFVAIGFFLIFMIISCTHQDDFQVLKGPYFGQKPPMENPELFMFGLISTLDVEYCISFLDQGRVCVFGRDDIGVNYTYLKDGHWTKPQKMPLDSKIGEWKHNAGPDDKTLYFMSPRAANPDDMRGDMNILKMEWTGSGWTEQRMLPFPPNSMEYQEIYPSFSSDGSAYFHSGEFRNAPDMNDDIYRSRCVNGIYQDQERLGEPISTRYGEYDAFVAPDEEYLMFGSNRPGGYGRYDTYICFKQDDQGWTHPINLGSELNSISWENRIMVTLDGKYMFFVSGRKHELLDDELKNGKRTSATGFYWVNTTFIQDLKKLMLNSACAADIVSAEYKEHGLKAAIAKLSELKNHPEKIYHFSPYELLMLCRQMIEAGKVNDAELFYQALLTIMEEDFRIKRGFGMVCTMHGLAEKGLGLLKQVMSDYPVELTVTVYRLGSDLLNAKKEGALEVMQFNMRQNPDHYLSHYGLARTYEQIGDLERAMRSCEKALQINPDYEPAENLLEQMHKRKDKIHR